MKKSIVLFTALCLLAVMTAQAQSAIVPAGGTASGNGGTVTYTAGQIAIQTNSDGTTSISEGVQQPFEISVVGVDERPDITLTAKLYPNPTLSTCNLQCDSWMGLDEVRIYDSNGKYLFQKKIEGSLTEMDFSSYAPGTYFVNVYSGKQTLKAFKVVKLGF